jgi:hypothetical protein
MRSALGKELRKLYRSMMKAQFPEYNEDKSWIMPQGWYLWTHQHSCGLWFHILLVISSKEDEFTNEIAWSYDGKQPEHELIRENHHVIYDTPMHVRSSTFWSDHDHWWSLLQHPEENILLTRLDEYEPIEKCMELIPSAIYDSAAKLKKFVIPVFEEIVHRHGKRPC